MRHDCFSLKVVACLQWPLMVSKDLLPAERKRESRPHQATSALKDEITNEYPTVKADFDQSRDWPGHMRICGVTEMSAWC